MSLIPGFQVGRASVKRVNILSDLIRQEEHPRLEEADLYFDTTFLAEGRGDRGGCRCRFAGCRLGPEDGQAAEPEIRELVWDLPGYRPMPGHDRSGNEGTGIDSAALVAIEDFGGEVPPWSISTVRCSKRTAGGPSGSPFSATRSSRAIS